MGADTSIPQWATDKRTLRIVSVVSGVTLWGLIAAVAVVEPRVAQAVTNVIFLPTIQVAAAIALLVIGLRILVVRDVEKVTVPASRLLVAYVLSALALAVASLLLAALAALAFGLKMPAADAFAQSFVALVGLSVFFSLTVKIVVSLQLLLRYRAKA